MARYFKFDYAIRNDDNEIVDSSDGAEPLSFVEGDGTTIPGLENALKGRSVGDEFSVTIPPDEAYGWPQRSLIRELPLKMFDADVDDINVGMVFQVGSGDETEVVKVVAMNSEEITIDGNHPLAGVTFHFDIQVLESREVTPGQD